MSATPEQIETALVKAVGDAIRDHTIANMEWGPLGYDGIAKEIIGMVRIFSTTNAAQSEREKVLVELLQRLEPSIGWRSAMGMSRDFMCEFCHQTHEHFAHIEHTDKCPVPQVRAALAGAR